MEGQKSRIVFLGAGNVASHLAPMLAKRADVVQIWSRQPENAQSLCTLTTGAQPVYTPDDIDRNADYYIICVGDQAIPLVAPWLRGVQGCVVHTSGTYSLEALGSHLDPGQPCGVFYPLQTFSRNSSYPVSGVPMLVEGDCPQTLDRLTVLANFISDVVYSVDSKTREHLHIAAVFACNFTNFLLDTADGYLRENTSFALDILHPLLVETLEKAHAIGPYRAQTGPAVRGDFHTINTHLATLDAQRAEIYRFLTEKIIARHLSRDKTR